MCNLRSLTVVLDKQVFHTTQPNILALQMHSILICFTLLFPNVQEYHFSWKKKKHRKEFKDTFLAQDLFGRLALIINFLKAAKRVGI